MKTTITQNKITTSDSLYAFEEYLRALETVHENKMVDENSTVTTIVDRPLFRSYAFDEMYQDREEKQNDLQSNEDVILEERLKSEDTNIKANGVKRCAEGLPSSVKTKIPRLEQSLNSSLVLEKIDKNMKNIEPAVPVRRLQSQGSNINTSNSMKRKLADPSPCANTKKATEQPLMKSKSFIGLEQFNEVKTSGSDVLDKNKQKRKPSMKSNRDKTMEHLAKSKRVKNAMTLEQLSQMESAVQSWNDIFGTNYTLL